MSNDALRALRASTGLSAAKFGARLNMHASRIIHHESGEPMGAKVALRILDEYRAEMLNHHINLESLLRGTIEDFR